MTLMFAVLVRGARFQGISGLTFDCLHSLRQSRGFARTRGTCSSNRGVPKGAGGRGPFDIIALAYNLIMIHHSYEMS